MTTLEIVLFTLFYLMGAGFTLSKCYAMSDDSFEGIPILVTILTGLLWPSVFIVQTIDKVILKKW